MDYSQASVKVVIDFIKFRIETSDGPIERTEHDITARKLEARIQRLKDRYGALSDPVPVGLEIAMDVFVPGDDLDTLAEIGADLWRMNTPDISPNQRTYGGPQASRPAAPPSDLPRLVQKVRGEHHIVEGNKDDPIFKKLYLKLSDDAGRIKVRPRIRLEFRLQGDACPFGALDALRGFDWRELRHWFRFRELRDDLDKLAAFNASNSDRIGKRRTRDRISQEEQRRKGTREFSRLTTSNQTLNRKADASLASLTRSWKGLCAQVKDVVLPGNLEQLSSESRANTGIHSITTLPTLDSLSSQPSSSTQASAAEAGRVASQPSAGTDTDTAKRPVPASPSPTAPAITLEGSMTIAEPCEDKGWNYPDDPW